MLLNRPLLLCFATLALALPSLASPIQYTINFSATSGALPTSGGFVYDAATTTFSNFQVTWQAITFDLTSTANSGPDFGITPGACGIASGASGSFQMLSGPPCTTTWSAARLFGGADFSFSAVTFAPNAGTVQLRVLNLPDPAKANERAEGTFSIAAVPEPSAGILFGLGLSALVLIARRFRSR